MEYHCKNLPATWGLVPALPVSVVNRNAISPRPSYIPKKGDVGCLGPDGLLYHPASQEASGKGEGALFQHPPKDEGGGRAIMRLGCRGWRALV